MKQRLSDLMAHALANPNDVNLTAKAHSAFLESTLLLPTLKTDSDVDFSDVVCQTIKERKFIPVFSEPRYMKLWAKDLNQEFSFIHMKASNLLPLLQENDYLCLDLETPHYKEFSPDEINYLIQICHKALEESNEGF